MGYEDFDQLRQDPDLDAIRADSKFDPLMSRLQKVNHQNMLCHEAVVAPWVHRLSHLYLFKCAGVGSDGTTATGSNLAEKHGLH